MNLGPLELVVILVVALLIFGPKNLPKLGSSLGKTVKNVREGMESDEPKKVEAEVVDVNEDDDDDDEGQAVVFCSKCGTKNVKGSAFCNKCGASIVSANDEDDK